MMREQGPLDHVEGRESVPSRRGKYTWSQRWEWKRVVGNEA